MASDSTETDELDHPLFSRLYRAFDPIDRRTLGVQRRELARGLEGRVVDVGAGDGAMFPFVVEATGAGQAGPARESVVGAGPPTGAIEYHAVEPDRTMRRRARDHATDLGLPVEFHDARAEALPFEDDSVDYVISSLVFCSVTDPATALDEVARVLRPDGEFRFLEHIGGTGYYRRLQEVLTPMWKRVAGGCHLDRDTADRFAGDDRFEAIELVRTDVRLYPAAPIVRGSLRRIDGG